MTTRRDIKIINLHKGENTSLMKGFFMKICLIALLLSFTLLFLAACQPKIAKKSDDLTGCNVHHITDRACSCACPALNAFFKAFSPGNIFDL